MCLSTPIFISAVYAKVSPCHGSMARGDFYCFARVYLKTPNAPGQRTFSRCAAPFFLEIRQYSCEKMSCPAQKFLAAGHIGSFQIHPKIRKRKICAASLPASHPSPRKAHAAARETGAAIFPAYRAARASGQAVPRRRQKTARASAQMRRRSFPARKTRASCPSGTRMKW